MPIVCEKLVSAFQIWWLRVVISMPSLIPTAIVLIEIKRMFPTNH